MPHVQLRGTGGRHRRPAIARDRILIGPGRLANAMSLRVGVLAVQGAVSEHLDALRRAGARLGVDVEAVPVRRPEELAAVQGLILPGGESTTISRLLRSGGLQDELVRRSRAGELAVFGTCAGLVLLSSRARHDVEDKDVQLLGLLDAEVDRNAFGRQRESFEDELEVAGVGSVPAVFIRAPVLSAMWGETRELARTPRGIVAARKGSVLGTSFHPELTPDTRMHEAFLEMCQAVAAPASPARAG